MMVDLLSVAIIVWLHLSLVFALFGLFLWAFSDDDDDDEKRFGSRIFFVSPVWPIAFAVWLVMNFRMLLVDAMRGSR